VIRLTQHAPGGGCSCKIAPGVLEQMLAGLGESGYQPDGRLLVGTENGDDAAVVRLDEERAIVTTTDFFPPVVDDAYDWGRIAAANALSDVYAMGGDPLVALSILAWPVGDLPDELAVEVLRGGRAVAALGGCPVAGGHSISDTTPVYGLAVTGIVDPRHLMRNDAARPGDALSLTKPLGVGVLNARHKATGERFEQAIETMATLNREAAKAARAAGIVAATDVTGFGLLGHLFKMARASGLGAVIDARAVPYLDGAADALRAGYLPGGSGRNLEWVRSSLESAPGISDDTLLLLADAQTSGGLLLAGEIPGAPVIGEFVTLDGDEPLLRVR
jgi:selenide,water dikinase